jgi:hypothetical protein
MKDLLYQSDGIHDLTMKDYYMSRYLETTTKTTYVKVDVSPVSLVSMSLAGESSVC